MPWPVWATERVELVESDPSWPACGMALAVKLNELLSPRLVATVEHVGSTAVPGLPAKPVLDLMAAVLDPDVLVRDGVARLSAAGWELVPQDVMRPHEPRWAQVLAFRDLLCAGRELARRYGELKTALARECADDRERYTEAKREFIEAALSSR